MEHSRKHEDVAWLDDEGKSVNQGKTSEIKPQAAAREKKIAREQKVLVFFAREQKGAKKSLLASKVFLAHKSIFAHEQKTDLVFAHKQKQFSFCSRAKKCTFTLQQWGSTPNRTLAKFFPEISEKMIFFLIFFLLAFEKAGCVHQN